MKLSRVRVLVWLLSAGTLAGPAYGDVLNMGGTRNADGSWTGLASLETVPVGNVGNAADNRYGGYGSVGHVVDIGKYEVTAGQYTEFLNAVAKTDTYGLYYPHMGSDLYGCKIQRSGASGEYVYTVASDWANRPVNYVSYWHACRFANWLHNGQPTGMQGPDTTERGAYGLDGYNGDGGSAIRRESGAKWAVCSEDEWYKAAYHKNGGASGDYWDYPTGSNTAPSRVLGNPVDPGNNATYHTTSYTIGVPYYRTEAGAHENSDSPYGTFDQAGNVWEWNESLTGSFRGLRGGSFDLNYSDQRASARNSVGIYSSYRSSGIGFRVAKLPPLAERGDLDGDGDVDGADYGIFASCFNGTGNSVSPACLAADFDWDRDVDGADYGLFAACFNGTGNPPACQ